MKMKRPEETEKLINNNQFSHTSKTGLGRKTTSNTSFESSGSKQINNKTISNSNANNKNKNISLSQQLDNLKNANTDSFLLSIDPPTFERGNSKMFSTIKFDFKRKNQMSSTTPSKPKGFTNFLQLPSIIFIY